MTAAMQAAGTDSSSGDPRGATQAIHPSAAVQAVFHELRPQFEEQLPASVVWDYVTKAAADLQGSICREALPEMVFRLATVRLERLLGPDQPADDTHHAHTTRLIHTNDHPHRSGPAGGPFILV